jgi:hypothetical protein
MEENVIGGECSMHERRIIYRRIWSEDIKERDHWKTQA